MNQDMLTKVVALRDEAFAPFKALDDAVVALGGKSRLGPRTVLATGLSVGTSSAKGVSEARRVTVAGAAELELHARGIPMTGADIMAALPARGVTVGGADPVVNFTSSMSKSGKFQSVRRNGKYYWWFKDEPLPEDWQEAPDLLKQDGPDASVAVSQEGW